MDSASGSAEWDSLDEWKQDDYVYDRSEDGSDDQSIDAADREEMEVALYGLVHCEPNDQCTVDYSQSQPQLEELLVEQITPTEAPLLPTSDDTKDASTTTKKKRPRKEKRASNSERAAKKAKVVMCLDSDGEDSQGPRKVSDSMKDLSNFLKIMDDKSSSKGADKSGCIKKRKKKSADKKHGILPVQVDSDSDVVLVEEGSCNFDVLPLSVSSSDREFLTDSESSFDEDMLFTLGNITSTDLYQSDLTVNMVGITQDTSLREVLDALPACDWKLSSEDMLGTGTGSGGTYKRYYGKINVTCRNCNEKGHMSSDCSKPKKAVTCILCADKGHISRSCKRALCYNCDQPGHSSQECEEARRSGRVQCHRCQLNGHMYYQCPDLWRQYHITMEGKLSRGSQKENRTKYCCNCARKGHFAHSCTKSSFTRHIPCVLPAFVAQYDDDLPTTTFEEPERKKKKPALKAKIKSSLKSFANNVKKMVSKDKKQSLEAGKKKLDKKKNKKNKKMKLDMAASGDFVRTSNKSTKKTKKQMKQNSGGDDLFPTGKHYKKVMNHVNTHYNTPNEYSPWSAKGKKTPRGKSKGRGKKPTGNEDGASTDRTVFISKRGFKVTAKVNR